MGLNSVEFVTGVSLAIDDCQWEDQSVDDLGVKGYGRRWLA